MRLSRNLLVLLGALAIAAVALAQTPGARVPASDLLGREIVSRDGRPLGELEDLIIDVRNARIRYAVLAFGGWMGLGEELYAVPLDALAPEPASRRLVLLISTAPLMNIPGLRRGDWPDDDYWRGIPSTRRGEARPPMRQFVRASELIGRAATDRTGKHAGEIEDAVLDLRQGVVLHLLFDYESPGPDLPPLRLAAQVFSFPRDGGSAVINLARERLARPEPDLSETIGY